MLHKELWFAWFPVRVRTRKRPRYAWLEPVLRECIKHQNGQSPWRYYAAE